MTKTETIFIPLKTYSKKYVAMNHQLQIGTNIKLFREKLNLTQDILADYLGTKREMISYYENGKRPIELSRLEKLADLFDVELHDLLQENPSPVELELAFAFRSEGLDDSDVNSISDFKRIVRNYIRMRTIFERDVN